MASSTPKYGLPYPALTDTPDVPYYMQQIAQQTEAVLQTLVVPQGSDATYPKAAAAITAETVVDRISVAAAGYLRTAHLAFNCYAVAVTNALQADCIIYASINGGAFTQVGYARKSLTVANPDEFAVTGKVDIPAGQTLVLEVRVVRFSGTGTLTTSVSTGLTNSNCLLVRK
jgi:hypothetical protein